MSDINTAIGAAERSLEQIREDMTTIQARFLDATSEALGEAIAHNVEGTVRREHTRSKQLGVEGLRRVKLSLNELLARVPALTAVGVSAQTHSGRTGRTDRLVTRFVIRPTATGFQLSSRGLLSKCSRTEKTLLREAGFTMEPSVPRVPLSAQMRAALEEYKGLDRRLDEEQANLASLLRQREEAAAQDLWEQA